MVRSGYTLPVFATASAVGALNYLQDQNKNQDEVTIDLINPPQQVSITIAQVAKISDNQAMAITYSDPGDNLDITRNTPIWAIVTLTPQNQTEIILQGGEGIGKISKLDGKSAIYNYAEQLLQTNLQNNLQGEYLVQVQIILPEGKKLARKTSNEAFGVVEGLSLLGTSGIAQPLTSKEQLDIYQEQLLHKAKTQDLLVFCIGENGLSLAPTLGFKSEQLIKTANWLGSMLVTAGNAPVRSIIILGYHGKLIKLAGNIFHTHHQLADARLEIFTGISSYLGLPSGVCRRLFEAKTVEDGLLLLKQFDRENDTNWQEKIYQFIADRIEANCRKYINNHGDFTPEIGTILFDRRRQIIVKSEYAQNYLNKTNKN